MYIIASIVMYSCTDDTLPTTSNNKARVVADDPGDPINPTPPIKP